MTEITELEVPYSSDVFDSVVGRIVEIVAPDRCIDIGSGAGKYSCLVRAVRPTTFIVAVEIEQDYISQFGLEAVADEVRCMSADRLIATAIDEVYDLAIFGDSLEHMRKSRGMDLLEFLVYRTRFILIVYPERYLQNSVNGYSSEAHLSIWTPADFASFRHTTILEESGQRLLVLEGYLSDLGSVAQIEPLLGYKNDLRTDLT